jgi:hypothetical protein
MKRIYLKAGVVFFEINEFYYKVFSALFKAEDLLNKPMIITSANDGRHLEGSKHYKNEALDLRTKHLTPDEKDKLFKFLIEELEAGALVIFEERGKENEHIHIQTKPAPAPAPPQTK